MFSIRTVQVVLKSLIITGSVIATVGLWLRSLMGERKGDTQQKPYRQQGVKTFCLFYLIVRIRLISTQKFKIIFEMKLHARGTK